MNQPLSAEIVSVGTELLLGQIIDTHAPTMARILAECGISCTHRQTVGDNRDRLLESLQQALTRSDIVITVGGLGPTVDDITRDVIAEALGDKLVREPEMEAKLREIFALRKLTWTDSILRQADKPESARFVDNPNGTAPGLICEKNGKTVIALPGPKMEFNPMAEGPVKDFLCRLQGGSVIHSRTLRVCGMGESAVEEKIRDLMNGSNPTVAPYAQPAEVHLRVTARAASVEEAEKLINPVADKIQTILGDNLFGTDKTTLEQATIDLALLNHATIAVAESMTGGALGARLTSVDGASSAFLGGVISYHPDVKCNLLEVSRDTIEKNGPVSEQTAREMAEGARKQLDATYGVSITGNAGPTSDVDGKPVGLVYIGVASPNGTEVQEVRFRGQREDIRQRATQQALVNLRNALLK